MAAFLSTTNANTECKVPVRSLQVSDRGINSTDVSQEILDKLTIAIAVFDADQRLASHNTRYARLWCFPQDWLDTRPSLSDILDRLRELRLLPEQRDFAAWKKHNLERFKAGGRFEDSWHIPNGPSLRVASEPHHGGFIITYEDISEMLGLTAANVALAAVQQATLDTIDDAVAVFDPDGRLGHANQAFAQLWNLSAAELATEPHFTNIAQRWTQKSSHDGIWDIVSAAIASEDPESYGDWGYLTRADGRELHLTPTRLPNGATLVTFRDLTDLMRFESLHLEAALDAA